MSEETNPASLPLNQRLFDLVRYCRAELHQQDLITDEEYTLLLGGPDGKCSVRNLESYDDVRAELTKLRTLTAAQSKALEKAETSLGKAIRVLRTHPDIGGKFPNLADDAYQSCKEALTLIQQAKEVGK